MLPILFPVIYKSRTAIRNSSAGNHPTEDLVAFVFRSANLGNLSDANGAYAASSNQNSGEMLAVSFDRRTKEFHLREQRPESFDLSGA